MMVGALLAPPSSREEVEEVRLAARAASCSANDDIIYIIAYQAAGREGKGGCLEDAPPLPIFHQRRLHTFYVQVARVKGRGWSKNERNTQRKRQE